MPCWSRGPQQWPRLAGASQGAARLYTDHHFATDNGRARFHVARHHGVASPISARYPFHFADWPPARPMARHEPQRPGAGAVAHTQEAALRR